MVEDDVPALGRGVHPVPRRGIADVGAGLVADDGRSRVDVGADLDCGLGGDGASGEGFVACTECLSVAEGLLDLRSDVGKRPIGRLEQFIVGRDDVLDLTGRLCLHERDQVDQHRRVRETLVGAVETCQRATGRDRCLEHRRRLYNARWWERRQILIRAIRVVPHGHSVTRSNKRVEESEEFRHVPSMCRSDGHICAQVGHHEAAASCQSASERGASSGL